MKKQPLAAFSCYRKFQYEYTEVTMKSIKRNNSSFWMIGSFLLILLIFLLLMSKTPDTITKETIEYTEVVALIKALDTEENENKYESLLNEEAKESDTTYGMLKEVLDTLDVSGKTSTKFLDNTSSVAKVERDKFFSIYENLIDEFYKRGEIALEEIVIIGVAKDNNENGKEILVTTNEIGICQKELFIEYAGYVTQTYVKRSQNKTTFLAVKEAKSEEIHAQYLYVTGQDAEGIHFLIKDMELVLPAKSNLSVSNDVIASITIEGGEIVKLQSFDEKINGKVLSINDTYVRLDEYGTYEFAENMKIYKVFDGLKEGTIADVALGYEFVDFVIEDGKVCACLIVADEEMEYIRVLIKTSNFSSYYHEKVIITCDSDYKVYKKENEYTEYKAYEEVTFSKEDLENEQMVKIEPDILSGKVTLCSVERNQGTPKYSGTMELYKKEEGIVVINEVLLEEYLYKVVPSEMPSYYASEALMAQAICARTYAYTKMQNAGLKDLGAHLDDSTSFQVYNNIEEQVSTTSAVRQTTGIVVMNANEPMETMYYSTSFGMGSGGLRINQSESNVVDLSTNKAFDTYIESAYESDFEYGEGFYRWNYETNLDVELLEKRLKECYNKNKNNLLYMDEKQEFLARDSFDSLGEIQGIFVAERSIGGRAEKLTIIGSKNSVLLCGEYNIRYTLLNEETTIEKQDNSEMEMTTLLPSAFFKITTSQKDKAVVGYSLVGGGYGHGNGMSQNGANQMAMSGYSYVDILMLFYENCTLEQIY